MLSDDLQNGWRALARSPGFSLTAALLLGLGVGAAAAVFTLVDSCLLKPLPFPDEGRLVSIVEQAPGSRERWKLHPLHLFLLEGEARSLDLIASYVTGDGIGFDLEGGGSPVRVDGAVVSAGFFPILGANPEIGRAFTEEEDQTGAPVVVLSHRLWTDRFGADPAVLGRTVKVSGQERTVVGIMPAGFDFPGAEIWLPGPVYADRAMGLPLTATYSHAVVARLKRGVALTQAQDEMKRLTRSLWEAEPWIASKRLAFTLVPLREALLDDLRVVLWVLFGATGLLLVITCTNLSNLLLGRLITRQPELVLRSILGATGRRLARQLVLESLLLGAAGAIAGLLLASLILRGMSPALAPLLPPGLAVRMDLRVLAFLVLVAALAGLLAGLVPVLKRSGPGTRLAESPTSSPGQGGRRLWSLLVVAQLALSFVLLAGVGLLLRSYQELAGRPLGFEPDRVLTFEVTLNKHLYPQPADRRAFASRLQERLSRVPGVSSAALSIGLPADDSGHRIFLVTREEELHADLATLPTADCWQVTPSFFETMGIRLQRGRRFSAGDHKDAAPVTIVDEAVAGRLWPDENAVGRRLNVNGVWREVVAVAAPVATRSSPRQEKADLIYVPLDQPLMVASALTVSLKADGDPQALTPAARSAVQEVSAGQTIYKVTTMADRLAEAGARERLTAIVLGLFAGLGLVLALSGLFAVVRFAAVGRRKEIGIRMALGAGRFEVLKLVLRQGGGLIAAGIAAGLLIALPASQLLSRLLYGVSATDPGTYAAVAALLIAVSLPAVLLPGIEAVRADPLRSIRAD